MVIGDLASIVDDSVSFYFNIMTRGTPLESAELIFKRVAPEFQCTACNRVFTGRSVGIRCPYCGGRSMVAGKGREFYIESIEVDDGAD